MYPSRELSGHLIVAGHHHPLLSLKDEVGCAVQTPAYLRAGLDYKGLGLTAEQKNSSPPRVMFMPAFNEILAMISFRSSGNLFPLCRGS